MDIEEIRAMIKRYKLAYKIKDGVEGVRILNTMATPEVMSTLKKNHPAILAELKANKASKNAMMRIFVQE